MKARFALVVVLVFTAFSAFSGSDVQGDLDWLQISAVAARQTDYSGIFAYQHGSHVETVRITHISDQNGEHEKLEKLDGPRREFIRSNNDAWWNFGDHKPIQVGKLYNGKSFPALLPEQLSALNENYRIRAAEQERIAGFDTQAVIFQPRDNLRYIHKIWIHRDSGLLMKSAVYDLRKFLVEQYTFIELKIGNDVDRTQMHPVQSSISAERKSQLPTSTGTNLRAANTDWMVVALPSGFKKTKEVRRSLHGKNNDAIHFVYSDGLAGISVFIEALKNNLNYKPGLFSRGAVHVYSKIKGDYLVTVVGEVPPRTVMQVMDSVRYKGQ